MLLASSLRAHAARRPIFPLENGHPFSYTEHMNTIGLQRYSATAAWRAFPPRANHFLSATKRPMTMTKINTQRVLRCAETARASFSCMTRRAHRAKEWDFERNLGAPLSIEPKLRPRSASNHENHRRSLTASTGILTFCSCCSERPIPDGPCWQFSMLTLPDSPPSRNLPNAPPSILSD